MKKIGNMLVNPSYIQSIVKLQDTVAFIMPNATYRFRGDSIQEIMDIQDIVKEYNFNIDFLYKNINLQTIDIDTITANQATEIVTNIDIPVDVKAKQNYYMLYLKSNICNNCRYYDTDKKLCNNTNETKDRTDTCDVFDKYNTENKCIECIHFDIDRCTLFNKDTTPINTCRDFSPLVKNVTNTSTCDNCVYYTFNSSKPCIINAKPNYKGACTNKIYK